MKRHEEKEGLEEKKGSIIEKHPVTIE